MKKVAKYVWPRKPEMTRIARSAHNRWNFKTGIVVTDLRNYGPRTLPPSLTVRSETYIRESTYRRTSRPRRNRDRAAARHHRSSPVGPNR